MGMVELVLRFTAIGLILCLGFGFLYESLEEDSYYPQELALPAIATRVLGVVLTVGSIFLFVWQLIQIRLP